MDTKRKLITLLSNAHSRVTEADMAEDMTYAQQLEMEADHLIAHGVTVQEWISVKDRLPMMDEVGEFVLVYTHEDKHLIVTCWAVHKHKEQIACWMPLPHPPEGE